jgi:hypothetical protein
MRVWENAVPQNHYILVQNAWYHVYRLGNQLSRLCREINCDERKLLYSTHAPRGGVGGATVLIVISLGEMSVIPNVIKYVKFDDCQLKGKPDLWSLILCAFYKTKPVFITTATL